MKLSVLLSICSTGLAVSFVHSILPTHWLPFVLAARGQKWTTGRTLAITALAAAGHVLFTTLLGVLVVGLGATVQAWVGSVFPWIAGIALIAFGAFYFWRGGHAHEHVTQFQPLDERAHDHHPHAHGHHHHHAPAINSGNKAPMSDRAVILGLLAALTFSPCEGFLPVYLSGISYGWKGFALLSAVLAAGTMAGMLIFTTIAMIGLQQFKLEALDRYENRILGTLLVALGVLVVVLEG